MGADGIRNSEGGRVNMRKGSGEGNMEGGGGEFEKSGGGIGRE